MRLAPREIAQQHTQVPHSCDSFRSDLVSSLQYPLITSAALLACDIVLRSVRSGRHQPFSKSAVHVQEYKSFSNLGLPNISLTTIFKAPAWR